MPHVVFAGELGRRLWPRIKDYLWLLEPGRPTLALRGEQRREAEVRMVSFLVCAGFGYGCRLDRFRYLSDRNPDIYRILYSEDEVIAEIDTGRGTSRLSLGNAEGFTAAIPLTLAGFSAYTSNQLAAHHLTDAHIIGYPYAPHSVGHVLIAGAVHFPAILEAERFSFQRERISKATRLIRQLLDQIAHFVPLVQVHKDPQERIRVLALGPHPLPKLVCHITEQGVAANLLQKAGFDFDGFDNNKNKKFVLDAAHVNEGLFDRTIITRSRMIGLRNSVDLLHKHQRGR